MDDYTVVEDPKQFLLHMRPSEDGDRKTTGSCNGKNKMNTEEQAGQHGGNSNHGRRTSSPFGLGRGFLQSSRELFREKCNFLSEVLLPKKEGTNQHQNLYLKDVGRATGSCKKAQGPDPYL